MMDPTYPLFPVFAFISFVIVLIPLPWHLQTQNVGTVSYMLWTAIAALNLFVNSVVWRNDDINRSPGWCDLSSHLYIIVNVAIPCASLTITRNLYRITRCQTVMSDPKEKRNQMIIDLLVCVFFPLFQLVFYWFIQGHRFNIYEQIGCFPVAVDTLPTYFLIYMWPLLLSVISAIYGGLTLWSFLKRRIEFSRHLASSRSFLNQSRYFRLMALAMLDTFLTIPFSCYTIWINSTQGISPWRGLADVHFGFGRVEQIPAALWQTSHLFEVSIAITRWSVVFCAFIFFLFFGFAEESRKHYTKMYWRVAKLFGVLPKPAGTAFSGSSFVRTPHLVNSKSNGSGSGGGNSSAATNSANGKPGGLRVYVSKNEKVKRDSLLSSIADLDSSITVDFEERKHAASSNDSLPASPDDLELGGLPSLRHSVPVSMPAPAAARPHPSEALVLDFPTSPRNSHVGAHAV